MKYDSAVSTATPTETASHGGTRAARLCGDSALPFESFSRQLRQWLMPSIFVMQSLHIADRHATQMPMASRMGWWEQVAEGAPFTVAQHTTRLRYAPSTAMAKLLLLQVGHTFEHLARARGDYDAWFRDGLGVGDDLEVVKVSDGEHLPGHYAYRGVVVTGSAAMVTHREPWSVATAAYLLELARQEVPILGVCYGHQLLADALGGEVADNPRGRSVGTMELELTPMARECPLFSVLPEPPVVQVSHKQSVLRLPERAALLASSPRDPNHAFRIGESIWGVQFHPEFDATISREYITSRANVIVTEGSDIEQLLQGVQESDHGSRLLRRFAEIVS
jgi:GMP synthase (glutamine-hydrolysing)